jgi:hypothetical protein
MSTYFRLGWLLLGLTLCVGNTSETRATDHPQKGGSEQPATIQPTWVFQGQPMGQMLAVATEAIRRAGKAEGQQWVESFDKQLKTRLGEKGFAGLDLNRPWGGFGLLPDKLENAPVVLIFPTTGPDAFLDLMQRLKFRCEKDTKDNLLYKTHFPPDFPSPFSKASYLRFVGGNWAYLMLNVDQAWPAAALPTPEALWKERPQAIGSIRLYPGRVPPTLIKSMIQEFENEVAQIRGFLAGGDAGPWNQWNKVFFDGVPTWVVRNIRSIAQEAEEIELQIRWELNDPSGHIILDATLRPKAGTPLSRVVQQRGQSQQRFAGLGQLEPTAVCLLIQPPQFAPEWQKLWSTLGAIAQEELKGAELPKEVTEVFLEVARSWQRDSQAGKLEGALLLREPNAKGFYSAALVWSCEGARTFEKALHQVARQRTFAPFVQMDVAKAGEWTVHRLKTWPLLPAEVRDRGEQLFGEDPLVYVACGPDALCLAVGPEAMPILQQISQLRPGLGAAFEWHFQLKHITALARILTGDEEVGEQLQNIFGNEKNKTTGLQVQLDGGEQLRLTVRCHDRIILAILEGLFLFRLG